MLKKAAVSFLLFPFLVGCASLLQPLYAGSTLRDVSVKAGETAVFSVMAASIPRISYQWQRAKKGSNNFVNVPNIKTESVVAPLGSYDRVSNWEMRGNDRVSANWEMQVIAANGQVGTEPYIRLSYPILVSVDDDGSKFRVCFSPTKESEANDPRFLSKSYSTGCSNIAFLSVQK